MHQSTPQECVCSRAGVCLLSSTFNPLLIPQVEEISATVSHKKAAEAEKGDPLDAYCEDNPDADECR